MTKKKSPLLIRTGAFQDKQPDAVELAQAPATYYKQSPLLLLEGTHTFWRRSEYSRLFHYTPACFSDVLKTFRGDPAFMRLASAASPRYLSTPRRYACFAYHGLNWLLIRSDVSASARSTGLSVDSCSVVPIEFNSVVSVDSCSVERGAYSRSNSSFLVVILLTILNNPL